MPEYTIYLSSDHRGFEDRKELVPLLAGCHPFVHVEDLGPETLDPEDDFNDIAITVSSAVLGNEHSFGVLICGSAHGVCMQANRIKGIRAINASTPESAAIGREDDYANVLCLSGDQLNAEEMEKIIKAFCHARPKTDEKYQRRMRKLDDDSEWPGSEG